MYKIQYPWGPADLVTVPYAATQNLAIENSLTILNFATLTGATTLNISSVEEGIQIGARLIVKVPATATETLTFGTGITAPALVGVAGKTKTQSFYFDGSAFIAESAFVQID